MSADPAAIEQLEKDGVRCITLNDVLYAVERWDWRKQDAAFQGLLHYLAHVEQNPIAVGRLLAFIAEHDPGHDALVYYTGDDKDSSSESKSDA